MLCQHPEPDRQVPHDAEGFCCRVTCVCRIGLERGLADMQQGEVPEASKRTRMGSTGAWQHRRKVARLSPIDAYVTGRRRRQGADGALERSEVIDWGAHVCWPFPATRDLMRRYSSRGLPDRIQRRAQAVSCPTNAGTGRGRSELTMAVAASQTGSPPHLQAALDELALAAERREFTLGSQNASRYSPSAVRSGWSPGRGPSGQ